MDFVHTPPNAAGDLGALYAYVSIDENGEGILAHILPGLGTTALVSGKPQVVEEMKRLALAIGKATNRKVRLVRFNRAQIVWEGDPSL